MATRKTTKQTAATTKQPSLFAKALDSQMKASEAQPEHLIVKARAGTGKTFTLISGVVFMFRDRCPGLWDTFCQRLGFVPVPSQQQQQVWDEMAKSSNANSVRFTAFNNSIVQSFEQHWGWVIIELAKHGITFSFSTNHSLGNSAVTAAYGRQLPDKYTTNVRDLAESLALKAGIDQKQTGPLGTIVVGLLEKVKGTLADPTPENLAAIAGHYDLDIPEAWQPVVFDAVAKAYTLTRSPKGKIAFVDMIWLPVINNLPVAKCDVLLVDEAQDLNKCQQQLVARSGKRVIAVGDDRQAIYGFAGADTNSLTNMQADLSANGRGVKVLPLTVTRRCGKAIVEKAAQIVPDFEAHENNSQGVVDTSLVLEKPTRKDQESSWYINKVQDGDMVLCRCNAPLVSECFKLLGMGKRATIQGKNIGAGLVRTIEKLKATSVDNLVVKLDEYYCKEVAKEQAKKYPDEERIINLGDKVGCIMMFADGAATVDAVVRRIEDVFTDNGLTSGIRLSSIHKAKGLEADNVFLLQPKRASCPHPMAKTDWARGQEMNLLYVAITRAKHHLYLVQANGKR